MIIELTRRLRAKLRRTWFCLVYAPRMSACGKKAFIDGPFRLDGVQCIQLGESSLIQSRGWLYCVPVDGGAAQLAIGARCVFGYNNHIAAVRNVLIEDDVLTANNVYISDNLHEYEDIKTPIMQQPIRFKSSVRIGSGTWIGENACIIGANVGRNCVIGSNSVVTHDVPDYSVVVGAPAKVIRQFDQNLQKWVNNKNL